jgi:hypothetical protein
MLHRPFIPGRLYTMVICDDTKVFRFKKRKGVWNIDYPNETCLIIKEDIFLCIDNKISEKYHPLGIFLFKDNIIGIGTSFANHFLKEI